MESRQLYELIRDFEYPGGKVESGTVKTLQEWGAYFPVFSINNLEKMGDWLRKFDTPPGYVMINLNDEIRVKLSKLGYDHICEYYKRIGLTGSTYIERLLLETDMEGYLGFQLWHFMMLFGDVMGIGASKYLNTCDALMKIKK
jgi:hypothetical protein